MRTPTKLLCITPKTGFIRRYVGRKLSGKAHTKTLNAERMPELEYFRLYGWPRDPEGGQTA